jgi:hypothetical protein
LYGQVCTLASGEAVSFYRMERGWMDHDAFKGEPYGQRAAWVWMIEHAAWKPTRHLIGGKFVPIGRGQFAGSLRFIAGEWGWGHERVRRFLKLLASDAMIETNIETGKFIITICNYNKYQAQPTDDETPRETRTRQQRDSNETLKNEGKEVKEEEDSEAKASGADAPDPVADLWKRGKAILGNSAASMIGKARKMHGDLVVMQAIIACETERPLHPVEYFIGCLRQSKKENPHDAETRAFRLVTSGAGDSGPDSSLALAFLDPAGTG